MLNIIFLLVILSYVMVGMYMLTKAIAYGITMYDEMPMICFYKNIDFKLTRTYFYSLLFITVTVPVLYVVGIICVNVFFWNINWMLGVGISLLLVSVLTHAMLVGNSMAEDEIAELKRNRFGYYY